MDPPGDGILATVGGHLNVHLSPISFEVWWHVGVSVAISEPMYFGFTGVYCSGQLVNAAPSFDKALVSEGGAALHC